MVIAAQSLPPLPREPSRQRGSLGVAAEAFRMLQPLRALLTWDCPDDLLAPLRTMDVHVTRVGRQQSQDEMCAAIADKHALLCHPFAPVPRAVIDAARELRVVSTVAVGYDNIDLAALRERGIPLGHTPGVVVESTADIAYALILGIMRRVFAGDRYVRAGSWPQAMDALGTDLAGKTLGIVGLGAIGLAVARRARASGMRIVYSNRRPRSDAPEATFATIDTLLREADCVCAMVPFSAETAKLFDARTFAKMKRGAYFVNAARGGIVDTQALHDALASGQLTAAAVDVLDPEPIGADHPLLALPNFFITPHIGTATYETRGAMAALCVANAVAGLRGEPLVAPVPA
jgi:glyoxylate reductase